MKNVFNLIFIAAFFSIISFVGCDDELPSENDIPETNVSYSMHIQPILNVKCALSGCHDDGTRASGYSMTSWSNVFRIPLILEGEAEVSHMVMVLTGQGGLSIMPPPSAGVAPVTQKELNGIKTWINEGAKNN